MDHLISGPAALHATFAGLVEDAVFVELGLANPSLSDYLTRLLVNSLRPDLTFSPEQLASTHIADLAERAAHGIAPPPADPEQVLRHRREVYRGAGDFVLFWVGVYPENVATLNARAGDPLADFRAHGQRFYRQAAELTGDHDDPPADLLGFLAETFPLCERGLHKVRAGLTAFRRAG